MTQPPEDRLNRRPRFSDPVPSEAAALLRLLPSDMPWRLDRRRFLHASAVGLGGLTAACSGDSDPADPGSPGFDLLTFCTDEVGAHQGVSAFAFSPDGRYLASGGGGRGDNHFKLWEMASGRLVASLSYSGSGFGVPVAFDRGGAFAAGHLPGRLVLISVPDGTVLREWDYARTNSSGAFALSVSDDGTRLAYADGPVVRVIDTGDGSVLTEIDTPASFVQTLALRPDGSLLAVGSYGNLRIGEPSVYLYSVPDGQTAGALADPAFEADSIRRVSFTRDGTVLVVTHEYRDLLFWDVDSATITARVSHPLGSAGGFTTHGMDDEDRVYAMAGDVLEIFEAPTGALVGTVEGLPWSRGVAIEPSPDGRTLVYGSGSSVRVYDVETGRFRNCFFDENATAPGGNVSYYSIVDTEGREIWYTLPCGDPIPAGAACTCNCVGGRAPQSTYSPACSINFVCTCIPVIYGV